MTILEALKRDDLHVLLICMNRRLVIDSDGMLRVYTNERTLIITESEAEAVAVLTGEEVQS